MPPLTKQKGDFILAQDWNSAMSELVQLRTDLASQTIETIAGDLRVGGRLGVGTSAPQAKLHVVGQGGGSVDLIVNGRLRSNNNDGGLWVASNRFVGGHSANQIGFWNGNAWRLTVRPDGNVGIGTLAPQAQLHVVGRGGGSVDLIVNGRLRSDSNDGGLWVASDRFVGGHSTNQIGFYSGNAWRLTVRPDGNVGIGTLAPQAKLEVNGNIKATGNSSGQGELLMEAPADGNHRIDRTADEQAAYKTGLVYRVKDNPASTAPIFQVRSSGQAVRLFVDHDGWTGSRHNSAWFSGVRDNYFEGRMGIGTFAAGFKLNVNGNTNLGGTLAVAGATTLTGNVGIGTPSTGVKLQIVHVNQDAGGNTLILGPTNQSNLRLGYHQDYSWVQSHGSKPLAINPLGNNVGIGTTSPTVKLEVNGAVKATSFVGDGSGLTGIDALSQAGGTLSGALTIEDALTVNGTVTATTFEGDGSALTGIDALSQAGGTLSGALTIEDALAVNGTVTAQKFVGDGSGLTGVASKWLDKSDETGIVYRAGKNVTIGAANSGTSLQILNKNQDATGDTLILGRSEGSHLRLGYHSSYSWVQSQSTGEQPPTPLAINPLGGHVGIGIVDPKSRLHVHGGYVVISNRSADDAGAAELLGNLPENSTVVGSPNERDLVFYWKGGDGTLYRGAMTGTELTPA